MRICPFLERDMGKRNLMVCVIGIMLSMMLVGCAETPKNVEIDIANRKQNETKGKDKLEGDVKLESIADVVKNTPTSWQEQKGNLVFDGIVQMPDVDELYKYKIGLSDKIYQHPEQVRKAFLDYFDDLNGKDGYVIDHDKEVGYGDYVEYYDESDTVEEGGRTDCILVRETGSAGLYMLTDYWSDIDKAQEWQHVPANESLEYVDNYYFEKNGKCIKGGEDTITLYENKQIKVQPAMDDFKTVMEIYEKESGNVYYVPDRISIFHNPHIDSDIMTLHATMLYDGVRVDDADLIEQPIKDYGNLCRLNVRAEQMEWGEGQYPYWTSFGEAYVPEKKLETYKEMLTFENAWNRLLEKVATEEDVVINRADLMYSVWYKPNGDTDEGWTAQMNEPPEIYASPVWRFVSYRNAQESYAYYVDAITGEVTAYEHAAFN